MDPKENLDKTIEELTAAAEAQKDEAVVEEVKVEEVAEPVAEAKEPVVPEPVASEPVASEPEKDDIVFSDKPQKKGKGLVLGMILFALLAAGGVGFGVWEMMDKNAEVGKLNTQIADLKKQITQLKKQIPVDYEDEEGTEDEEPADVEVEDVETEEVDTTDYIYVGEWGIKIKIPESLKGSISYVYSGNFLDIVDTDYLYLGMTESEAVGDKHAMLTVVRTIKDSGIPEGTTICNPSCSTYITTINGYSYLTALTGNNIDVLDTTALHEMESSKSFSPIE